MKNEDGKIEYKRELTNRLKREIVSFLNSDGGTIYLGVDDNRKPLLVSLEEKHKWEDILSNWVNTAFYPIPFGLIEVLPNEPVFTIRISAGNNRPYAIEKQGFDSNGVYVREGSHAVKASNELIKRMQQQNLGNGTFDSAISNQQNLTFDDASRIFNKLDKGFDENSLRMVSKSHYNNAAVLISEQNPFSAKVAIYDGLSVMAFKDKKEFNGSITSQIDSIMSYLHLVNRTQIIFTGSPQRHEKNDYPEAALRESVVNAFVHRDYFLHSNIKIEIFDDHLDVISPGGIPDGLTLAEIEKGLIAARNPRLIHILDKMGYIENYGTGIRRIISAYANDINNPTFFVSDNMFKVTLPNQNYQSKTSDYKINDSAGESSYEMIIIETLRNNQFGLSRTAIERKTQLSRYQSLTTLKNLLNRGLIEKIGVGRSTKYQLIRN